MKNIWLENPPRTNNPLRFILFVSRPYSLPAFFAVLAVIVAAGLNASTSYVYKTIVNSVEHLGVTGSSALLWQAAVLYILISVVSGIAWRVSGFIGMHWSTGVRATARYALTSYVTQHSHEYFSERFGGSIASKINTVSSNTKSLVENFMWQITAFLVTIVTSFTLAFLTNRTLGWVFVGWVILILIVNVFLAKKRVPLSTATQRVETELGGATVDMITNISAVHEYARRPFEISRIKEIIERRRKTGLRSFVFGETTLLINSIVQDIFSAVLVLGAVHYVILGQLSAGDMVLLLTLVLVMEDRLTFIGSQLNHLSEAWGEVSEGLSDILIAHDVSDKQGVSRIEVPKGEIKLSDVTFKYDGKPVFEHLSLTIPAGQRVGLIGRSGAGKSSLIKIILRHYDLDGGAIYIDDQNISTVTKDSLRDAIAVVPQEPLLFHRTIRDNIRYGNPEATEADVVEAASRAQAHEFIEQVPEGYNALVGERGIKLSGGQRQRVAIARAFLKNAPILILDEATSALDSESEVLVQKALFALMENKTVLAIAHRLSTLRAMDRLIVMDAGKIVEDGTHDDLLAAGGVYADLWRHQAGGFLAEDKVPEGVVEE